MKRFNTHLYLNDGPANATCYEQSPTQIGSQSQWRWPSSWRSSNAATAISTDWRIWWQNVTYHVPRLFLPCNAGFRPHSMFAQTQDEQFVQASQGVSTPEYNQFFGGGGSGPYTPAQQGKLKRPHVDSVSRGSRGRLRMQPTYEMFDDGSEEAERIGQLEDKIEDLCDKMAVLKETTEAHGKTIAELQGRFAATEEPSKSMKDSTTKTNARVKVSFFPFIKLAHLRCPFNRKQFIA